MTPEQKAELDRIFNADRAEQDRRNAAAEKEWEKERRIARECAEEARHTARGDEHG